MYQLLKNLWIMGRIDKTKIDNAVIKGLITKSQAEEITTLEE